MLLRNASRRCQCAILCLQLRGDVLIGAGAGRLGKIRRVECPGEAFSLYGVGTVWVSEGLRERILVNCAIRRSPSLALCLLQRPQFLLENVSN